MVFLKIHLVISIGFFVTISFLLKIIFWHRLYVQRTPLKLSWSIQLISSYLHTSITQKLVFQFKM